MQNMTEWQLFHLAEALTRAKRLEKKREDFHEELYACIIYPSFQIDPSIEQPYSHATDSQAIRIIEAKERYERLIHKEYERHVRWQSLLDWLDEHDRGIAIRYFVKKESVQPKIINRLLAKVEERIEQEEKRIEQELTDKSIADYEVYQEATKSFRRVSTHSKEPADKKRYLVNGKFVYMTEEEYQDNIG